MSLVTQYALVVGVVFVFGFTVIGQLNVLFSCFSAPVCMMLFITWAKEDMFYVFVVVCLSVSTKTSEWICMKFSGKVGNGPLNK